MSSTQVIDGKVVEMRFNNADFEKNVAQSMSTLDKLKQSLNFDSAKSLQALGAATKNFSMASIGYAVDGVQAKFSALQVVGMTAISEITKKVMQLGSSLVNKVMEPIRTGGMNRALNIEQAKFQLEGLGVAWESVKDDIDYAVSGTAYGLDAAAKAASQLTASGVQAGDDMKAALRGISGVAAMANSSYEEISPIFTTVAGQGKLMTMQLRQLEARGLNAAASIGKVLGKTEEEVRDMVTKGQISFEVFSHAMDEAFGEHAKDANKTFTGAMSNVRAAWSRIGAEFATPYMENMRLIAVASIDAINGIKKAMAPIFEGTAKVMEQVQTTVVKFLGSLPFEHGYTALIDAVTNSFRFLGQVLKPVKQAFKDIFPKKAANVFNDIAVKIDKFTQKLTISSETSEKLRNTFKGVFAIFKIAGQFVSQLITALSPLKPVLANITGSLLGVSGNLGDFLTNVSKSVEKNKTFLKIFQKIGEYIVLAKDKIMSLAPVLDTIKNKITSAASVIGGGFGKIIDAFKEFKANNLDNRDLSGFNNFVDTAKERLGSLSKIGSVISSVFGVIMNLAKKVAPIFSFIGGLIGQVVGDIAEAASSAFQSGNMFATFFQVLSATMTGSLISQLLQMLKTLTANAKDAFGLRSIAMQIKDAMKTLQAEVKADVISKIAKAILTLAGALFIMSTIRPERLVLALAALGLMANRIEDFMNKLSNLNGKVNMRAMSGIASALQATGVAMLLLAASAKVLGSMDLQQLIFGVVSVIALLAMMEWYAEKLSGLEGDIKKAGGQLVLMAVGIRILAMSVKAMGQLDLFSLIKGLGATIGMIFALAAALQIMDKMKLGVGTGLAIIELAAGILILSKAVEAFGSFDPSVLDQGAAAVLGFMLALALFTKFTSQSKNMVQVGIAILAAAASMSILTSVIERLGSMDFNAMNQGMQGLIVSLSMMTVALLLLSNLGSAPTLLAAAASMLIVSVAIGALTIAIVALGSVPIKTIVQGIIALGVGIGILAGMLIIVGTFGPIVLAAAAAFLIFGAAVLAIGGGILLLSAGAAALAVAGSQGAAGLLKMTGAIAVFAVAALLLTPTIPLMLLISAAMVGLGVACLAVGGGVALLSFGLSILAVYGGAAAVAIMVVAESLLKLSGALVAFGAASTLIIVGCLGMAVSLGAVALSIAANVLAFGLLAVVAAVTAAALLLFGAGGYFAAGALVAVSNAILLFLATLSIILPTISEAISGVVELGRNLVEGFIKGIEEKVETLKSTVKGFVTSALEMIGITQKSHSPSEVTDSYGHDFGDGYAQGINDSTEDVKAAVENMVKEGMTPLENGADEAALSLDDLSLSADGAGMSIDSLTGDQSELLGQLGLTTNGIYDQAAAIDYLNTKTVKCVRDESNAYKERTRMYGGSATAEAMARKAQEEHNKSTKDGTKNAYDYAAAMNEASAADKKKGGSAKKAAEDQKDLNSTLQDTIKNQLDMFKKLELKSEVSAEQMLDNMRSNINGMATWSHKMTVLAERGIDQGLLQKLAELGPQGYETMDAFFKMTAEQLQEANQLWATGLTLPESQAAIVNSAFTYAGEMAVQGFSNALDDHKKAHDAAHGLGEAAITGLNESLDEHSPSKATEKSGVNAVLGLANGFKSGTANLYLETVIKNRCKHIIEIFETALSEDKMEKVGSTALMNIFKDIFKNVFNDISKEDNPVVKGFVDSLKKTQTVITAINQFATVIRTKLNSELKMTSSTSNSLLFAEYAASCIKSFNNAIIGGVSSVKNAMNQFVSGVKSVLSTSNLSKSFENVGKNAAIGLANGINSQADAVAKAADKLGAKVDKALSSRLEVESPSKVTTLIGYYVGMGLVNGMEETARSVYRAAESVADAGIDGLTSNEGRIQDLLTDGLDYNPVITPRLDLSVMRAQLSELGSMMGEREMALNAQNGGNFSTDNDKAQSITFTQNNYSPKALSRIEIYRQTKNQISMMKGALA